MDRIALLHRRARCADRLALARTVLVTAFASALIAAGLPLPF